ncbi:MAG: hypothetical protein ACREDR_40910 [Blastocatellia bacterium]
MVSRQEGGAEDYRGGGWVRIEEHTEFCVKDGKIYLSIDDVGHVDEFLHIYDHLGLLAQALNPELTPDIRKSAVENEPLEFGEELVKSGRAIWKSDIHLKSVRKAIDGWRTERT